ncbi:MAG: response regulator, partial [Planctomycetales bacterium]|nr:response regulator [Planctomycetales bacterium]
MTRAIRVLLVDDEPADRALASRALTNGLEQVVIEESDSRSSLLSLLNANDYDVIITDYMLRGLNGLEVIDLVHELNADAQIIMLTGTGTEEVAIEAMKRGVADYVIKNAHHINRLPATVTHVLDRVAAEKARQKAEEKRKECEARLAHAGRLSAVGEMAAELAHELAQPLCVIDGYTVAMLNHIENNNEPPKALAENLEEIRKASERAGKLVRRMREFCRKNKGQRVPFNMNQAVSESVDFLAF